MSDKFSALPLRLSLFFPNSERHRRGFGGEESWLGGGTVAGRFRGLGGGGGTRAKSGRGPPWPELAMEGEGGEEGGCHGCPTAAELR